MLPLKDILTADYSHADAAFALQHGNLSAYLKNMNRNRVRYYPRKVSAGPGGGAFRYGHILEIALHLAIGSYRPSHIARGVVAGFDRLLTGNEFALKKINKLPGKERNAIYLNSDNYEMTDWPTDHKNGQIIAPRDNTLLLDFPQFALTEDVISRDPENPTFLIYNPAVHEGTISTEVELIPDMALSEVQKAIIRLRSDNGTPDFTDSVIEDSDDLPVLNLTSMLNRMEARLSFRLQANKISDFR